MRNAMNYKKVYGNSAQMPRSKKLLRCQLEGKSFCCWSDVSCQPWVDVFIKVAMFKCKVESQRKFEVKRSHLKTPYALINFRLSVLDSTLVANRGNKEIDYFCIQFFVILLLLSPGARCNSLGWTAGAIYNN